MKLPDVLEKEKSPLTAVLIFYVKMENNSKIKEPDTLLLPDLTDIDEARKAFIASEIFNRKY